MKIFLPRAELAAALTVAAEQDIRYCLNGVRIKATPEETRIVATDGAMLVALKCPASATEPVEFTIPSFTVEAAVKSKVGFLILTVEGREYDLDGHTFQPVDGKFPDYRRVLPRRCSGEASYFDVERLAVFLKIAKILKQRPQTIVVRQNGQHGGAIVQLLNVPHFVGVLMPLNPFPGKGSADPGIPTWPHQ